MDSSATSSTLFLSDSQIKQRKTTSFLSPLTTSSAIRPEMVCSRVSTHVELDIPLPASVAWSLLGDFSADWLSHNLPSSSFASDTLQPFTDASSGQEAVVSPLFHVSCSFDGGVRSVKMTYKKNRHARAITYTDKLIEKDDINMKYVYTRQEYTPTSLGLIRSLNNANHVYGMVPPVTVIKHASDDLDIDLDMSLDEDLVTDSNNTVLPSHIASLMTALEEQSTTEQALYLHKKYNTTLTDDTAPVTFINHISSFRVIPSSFSSCKLVWRSAADPVIPPAYKHVHTTAADAARAQNLRSTPTTPTTVRAGMAPISTTPSATAMASTSSSISTTLPSPAALSRGQDAEDVDLNDELSLELDDAPVHATLRAEAEAAVWARLHALMDIQCRYIRHAVKLATDDGMGLGVFPAPTVAHAEVDRQMAGPQAFLSKLMQQWEQERGVSGRNLASTLTARTGKFSDGPVLGQYMNKLAPILLDGMAHVSREYIRYGEKLADFEKQRLTRPLMVPLKPFNALHCLAAYLVAHNSNHNGQVSDAARTLMDTLTQ